ncbi:hypothetical protein NQ318_008429 [Aromia moschata]|uniref:Macro domain-containing protein n=1 Tax=Aromia moschata TaxID=1265417 RepID=A0AAV8YAL5_9CUCU|nr:hypothetical protein NQ318_008429 [Aromia moschata]
MMGGTSPVNKSGYITHSVDVDYLQNYKAPGKKLPRGKPRVVHFNHLAPFAGSNEEQAEVRARHVNPPDSKLSFEEFMLLHSNGQKARYGVTQEEPQGIWTVGGVTQTKPRGWTSPSNYGGPARERSVFYLVTKQLSHHKPTYQNVWDTLVELRDVLLSQNISSLAILKIASGLDGLNWRVIRSMLEVLSQFTGIEILVCCYNPRRSPNERTVDCFFYRTSRCKNDHSAGIVTDQRMTQFETKCRHF